MEAPFSLDTILRRYRDRRPSIQTVYERMYNESFRLVNPCSVQRTFSAAELPNIAACLPGADTIFLGICTIGPALETRVSILFNEDSVAGVVLDEIGTHWVNGLGREMHERIRTIARIEGKRASPSYRPGIGRWPLALQDQLLDRLPAAEIGVELVHGMIMPQKSISMIVGVGTKIERSCNTPGGSL